jgi:hypothetical protein
MQIEYLHKNIIALSQLVAPEKSEKRKAYEKDVGNWER